MASVDFYLLTVGIGEQLANRFGHTGIRVRDHAAGTDVVFNWGKFSFDDPAFGWKFFRGSLVYSMGVRTFENDVRYHYDQNRLVIQDKLNLTLKQKRKLMEKIAWNAIPENRDFAYQYWFKNCSTIPRDYLDEVLEGQVRSRYFQEPAGLAFRHYVRENLASIPFAAPMLDILMNGNIDRPITMWEQMFLPWQLRERLAQLPSVDDEGNPVAGTRLLIEKQTLIDRPEPWDPGLDDAAVLATILWAPIVIGLPLLAWSRRRPHLAPVARRVLGTGLVGWGLFSGLFGLTLALNWAFSGHPDGWANVNLLLLWPTDFVFAYAGWRLWRGESLPSALPLYALAHAGGLAGLIGLAAGGVFIQDIWTVAAWWGSLMIGYGVVLVALALAAVPAAQGSRSLLQKLLMALTTKAISRT
jgi:hypothetical protein